MRILVVSDYYPPYIGGAHRQTQLLARELVKRGHDVHVATYWQPGMPAVENDSGFPVYRIKQLRAILPGANEHQSQLHGTPFPDPVTVWQLGRVIRRVKPEVIHAYGWITFSCAVAMTGLHIPMLITDRDYNFTCATRTMLYNNQICDGPQLGKCLRCSAREMGTAKGWLTTISLVLGQPILLRKTTGAHSVSRYVQRVIRRDLLGSNNDRRLKADVVIHSFRLSSENASDPTDPELKPYLDQLPKEPFMLFVGGLQKRKGVHVLLEAYRQLKTPPPLVLIGYAGLDGPADFPDNVYVLKDFPHPAVMAAWERAMFGVFPSLWAEPLGGVVQEAMSRSRAVIGTKPGGHEDMIIDGETGFLVPMGDAEALASAMQTLIGEAPLRERMGQAAGERSALFLAENAVPQFEAAYRQILG
jgi:glycosyltransferase involved in cell wall biosynthesis